MTGMKKLATVGALLCSTTLSAQAEELRFDNLFVIGDSLSDGGTYSQAVQAGGGGLLPAINYRFLTNAPDGSSRTYGEILASKLGINLQPNVLSGVPAASIPEVNVGGTDYAQGGARVTDPAGIGNNPAGGITTLPLASQVDKLLSDHPTLGQNDLIVVWGGANDVFAQAEAVGLGAIDTTTAAGNMAQAASELAAQVARLKSAGAQSVMVVTIPDIGTTPAGIASGASGAALQTALVDTFNAQLKASIGSSAVIVDSQKLLGAVQADPAKYGFTASNAATVPACPGSALQCIQGVNASADSETRVFADGVHPTTAAHAVFGQAAFAGLQAATQTGAMSVAMQTALRQHGLSIENRMSPFVLFKTDENGNHVRREVGDVDVFASYDVGSFSSDAQQVTPGLTGDTGVFKAGADIAILPFATIGAGISLDRGTVEYDNDAGSFDSKLRIGVVFGQMALSKQFYLNAAAGTGQIDVNDITRRFALGPATEVYTGETDGDYKFYRFGGGGIFSLGEQVRLNPFAHYTYEKVSLNGYTESSGAASLSFGKTEYESRRITAGMNAIISPANMPGWTFALRGSVDHDLNDDPLKVSLGPDASTLGTVSAPRPDQTWGYVSASVVKDMGPGSFLSFTASSSVGLDGSRGYVGSVAYKMSF